MPLFIMVAVSIVGWVHLIKMHVYMMTKLNMCCIPRYTIDNDPIRRNITQPNRWQGFYLQLHTMIHSIYTSHTFNANKVKTEVLHSPPPLIALSSVLYKIEQNATLVPPQCSMELNKNGCANRTTSSSSHVASLGPQCSHCTFTCHMSQFRSIVTFLSRMRISSIQNSPSGST